MPDASEEVPERRAELAALSQVLTAGRPALVTLTGARGSGKSFVTRFFLEAAVRSGWRTTPYRDGRGVRVGSGTTETDLSREVAAALTLNVPSGRRPLRRLAGALQQQARLTPLVIVFDPYSPDPALKKALIEDILLPLRESTEPVVVLVVSRTSLQAELSPDLELNISTPTEDDLRARLAMLTTVDGVAIDATELDQYVAAARSSPRVLASLVAVLPVGVSGSQGPSGSFTVSR